jgi:uncharacterized protein (TIGR03067 family)
MTGLLAGVLVICTGDAYSGQKKDGLDGTWEVVSRTINGKKEEPKNEAVVIKGETLTLIEGKTRKAKIVLMPKLKPAGYDLTYKVPGVGEYTMKGIYTVDGVSLTMCQANGSDQARPTAFTSTATSNTVVTVYKKKTESK